MEEPMLQSVQSDYSSLAGLPNQEQMSGESQVASIGQRTPWSWLRQRYGSTRKCVSSKAALLILVWSFVLGLWYAMALNPDIYWKAFLNIWILPAFGGVAVITCFFPLAGFLADVKFGRYKTVIRSLALLLLTVVLLFLAGGVFAGSLIKYQDVVYGETYNATASAALIAFMCLLGFCGFIIVVLSCIGVVGFTANVIQFGMDQLHDSPGEDRTLFIHWYVWVYFLSIYIGQIGWNLWIGITYSCYTYYYVSVLLLCSIPVAIFVVLIVTLCLARRRRRWFLIEPGTHNPYKLVYRVTKFARQHKVPVHRSAFTYCEDEIPTGLDLGKVKYGGPFTTEQVENVKAFYGILKVLCSFGVFFLLDFAADIIIPALSWHNISSPSAYQGQCLEYSILISSDVLSPMLVVVYIPVYLCLLRPLLSHYVPGLGMLRRMGLGILMILASLAVPFSIGTVAHANNNTTACMFSYHSYIGSLNPVLVTFPESLSALSHVLVYTASYEFICSQSPHSMKGLLIGLLYTIKGLFQGLATLLALAFAFSHSDSVKPSCGFYYYLTNIVLGLVGALIYTWVARRYRYRERDEPSNIHRYAEEYYSNTQQERGYDYSYTAN